MIRSMLFVPAKEKMLQKIASFNADAYIIDLEDSILPTEKESALNSTVRFLESEKDNSNIYIRLDNDFMDSQIKALQSLDFAGYMLPKFEDPDRYNNSFSGKRIIALVETPMGLVNIEKITACPWVPVIAFGAEDYSCSLGMKNSYDTLLNARSRLIMYSKAYGKQVYDTPSFNFADTEGLKREVEQAADMGFDGKLAVNPKQIDTITSVFKYYDTDYFKKIIEIYENSDSAVVNIDGKIYEKMHIARMKKIIKEG